jgi:hypothetical protein
MRKLILAFSALILASGMVKPLSGRIIPTAEAQPVPCSYDYQGAGCPSGRPEISAKVACSPNQYNGGSNGITNPLGYESEPMLNATNNTWIYSSCVPPPPVCPANYIQSGTPTWLGNQWSQPSCSIPPSPLPTSTTAIIKVTVHNTGTFGGQVLLYLNGATPGHSSPSASAGFGSHGGTVQFSVTVGSTYRVACSTGTGASNSLTGSLSANGATVMLSCYSD